MISSKEIRKLIACTDLDWVAAFADIIVDGDNWAGALSLACSTLGIAFPVYELQFAAGFQRQAGNWDCTCECGGVAGPTINSNKADAKCLAARAWIEQQLERESG